MGRATGAPHPSCVSLTPACQACGWHARRSNAYGPSRNEHGPWCYARRSLWHRLCRSVQRQCDEISRRFRVLRQLCCDVQQTWRVLIIIHYRACGRVSRMWGLHRHIASQSYCAHEIVRAMPPPMNQRAELFYVFFQKPSLFPSLWQNIQRNALARHRIRQTGRAPAQRGQLHQIIGPGKLPPLRATCRRGVRER